MLTRLANRRSDRSGITLTEILISIMIMGVGIISLATLFPLGLLRLRNAQRLTRGAHLVESAASDLAARNLLAKLSFDNPFMSPWYVTTSFGRFDPWVQDTPGFGNAGFANWGALNGNGFLNFLGVYRGYGGTGANDPRFNSAARAEPGLPVAYDPLWRAITGSYPATVLSPIAEGRFGSGIGFLRNDPNGGAASSVASAHGLQRVTNFRTYPISSPDLFATVNYDRVLKTFISPEDLVLQESGGVYIDPNNGGQLASPSTVVPDLSMGGTPLPLSSTLSIYPTQNDWRYTWMFTGRRSDATDGATYDGDIVIHENRQFALDAVPDPSNPSTTIYQPAGETVVEAVWGYSASPGTIVSGNIGYGNLSSARSVLLRWPSSVADPDVRVGGWIADVTYERVYAVEQQRKLVEPLQRCHWYQVTKKSDPVAGRAFGGDPSGVTYREMSIWVSTPVRARTPLNFGTNPPSPYHVEAALIAPTVVNVYPWSGVIR